MRHVQAKRLYHSGGALLKLTRHRHKGVRREQSALAHKLLHLTEALLNVSLGYIRADVFFLHGGDYLITPVAFVHGYDVVCHIVHRVNRA